MFDYGSACCIYIDLDDDPDSRVLGRDPDSRGGKMCRRQRDGTGGGEDSRHRNGIMRRTKQLYRSYLLKLSWMRKGHCSKQGGGAQRNFDRQVR